MRHEEPHIYTKAKKETPLDCFGRLHNRNQVDCQICAVARSCQRSLTATVSFNSDVHSEQEKENTVAKKKKKNKKLNKSGSKPKKMRKSKKSSEFRSGSAGWVCFQALDNKSCEKGKVFTADKYAALVKVYSKVLKVKVNIDAKVSRMLHGFVANGLLKRVGKGKFKRIA